MLAQALTKIGRHYTWLHPCAPLFQVDSQALIHMASQIHHQPRTHTLTRKTGAGPRGMSGIRWCIANCISLDAIVAVQWSDHAKR
jgi:hypothetical protein